MPRPTCLFFVLVCALIFAGHGAVRAQAQTSEGAPPEIVSPQGKHMVLKFHDEFNAQPDKDGEPYIDRSKWQTTFWQGSSERSLFGNLEAEYYTDKDYGGAGNIPVNQRLNPFSFETPGILTISAWRVPTNQWQNFWMGEQRCFASGLLISDQRFNFKYGYIEGRFKLPANRGAWPAFWLLGNDSTQTNVVKAHEWPPEIDIFEFFGHRPTKHSAGLIVKSGETVPWKFGYNEAGFDISKDFHTWGLEWNATNLVFTFDGKTWARSETTESLRRSMYLLVNLAVGGKWYSEEMTNAGTPHKPWEVDETTMPWKMECDYVRVYQE
jgi:beta-glucanase (GH16 family)